jgi:dienelactone hydrolase
MKRPFFLSVLVTIIFLFSCADNKVAEQKSTDTESATVKIRSENINYSFDTSNFKGFIAYDENKQGRRPVVLVVHEWWGLDDYIRQRTSQLAEMGYLAMAVDMYGDGENADNPGDALKMATPFYVNPSLVKIRMDAALAKVRSYSQADTANVAAIGYCFGGYVVLNAAKLGSALKGVVSFHGGLAGAPVNKDLLKAKVLVAHGGSDPMVPEAEVAAFKKSMDSIGADYTFKVYPNATHAFTNPNATETGKKFSIPIAYNGAADSASWNDMKVFFGGLFQ